MYSGIVEKFRTNFSTESRGLDLFAGHNFGQQLLQGCLSKLMAESGQIASWRIQVILQLESTMYRISTFTYLYMYVPCGHLRLKRQYTPSQPADCISQPLDLGYQ